MGGPAELRLLVQDGPRRCRRIARTTNAHHCPPQPIVVKGRDPRISDMNRTATKRLRTLRRRCSGVPKLPTNGGDKHSILSPAGATSMSFAPDHCVTFLTATRCGT